MKKKLHIIFCICILIVQLSSCSSNDADETNQYGEMIGTITNKEGVIHQSVFNEWYIRCVKQNTIDNVELYYPISLADSLKRNGITVSFSGALYKRDNEGMPAGTTCFNVFLTEIKASN